MIMQLTVNYENVDGKIQIESTPEGGGDE